MQCGACVIASRDPALMEVCGGAAIHADLPELAGAILRVLDDAPLREELRARGVERAREFSWGRTARLTRAVYEDAWRRFHA
jgi:glycosyltransferase involved in cell wall biosynthesis